MWEVVLSHSKGGSITLIYSSRLTDSKLKKSKAEHKSSMVGLKTLDRRHYRWLKPT